MANATQNVLDGALERLNKKIEHSGKCLQLSSRNGYIALDTYGIERGNCINNFCTADSKKQMLNTIYALNEILDINSSK